MTWLQIALTTTEPSPTLLATLLTEPERTSPTAKTPGQEVAKLEGAPTLGPRANEAVTVKLDQA